MKNDMETKSLGSRQLDLFDDWLVVAAPPAATQVIPEPVVEPDPITETGPVLPASIDVSRYQLALELAVHLNAGGEITSSFLASAADRAFGGTQSDGTYSPKDAYDAMEAGFNLHLLATESADWVDAGADWAKAKAAELTQRIQRLPTQTRRDPEMDEFQQFSTPPALAFVANWVAAVRPGDRMMEPSAGTGDLASWSHIAGADIVLNELSPRRHALLSNLFPGATLFRENAEQLDNILPPDTVPTVIVMNPPFSSTAGRVQGQRSNANGARHVEQALRRLGEGGRLVAIVGQGMANDRPAMQDWWREIKKKYNVRANIGIAGREYAKFGTTFDNQILVIDKTGPTTQPVLTGQVEAVAELPALLEGIRNDRKYLQRESVESTSRDNSEAVRDSIRPKPGIGDSGDDSRGARTESIGNADATGAIAPHIETGGESGAGHEPDDGIGARGDVRDDATGEPGGSGSDGLGGDGGVAESSGTGIAVEATESVAGEFTDSVFARYTPQRLSIPDAHAHPGKLVQSAAMAAVEPPVPTYTPALPSRVVRQGLLSIAQLESIVYAGQAHSEVLPNGSRKGFFIGDGTGVGKGREISGIILDNLAQDRMKAVWVSFNEGLINDARRDYSSIGGNPDSIFFQGKTKAGNDITQPGGILFTTYSTLRGGEKKQATDLGQKGGKSRLEQMVEWLGKDFDGVIAFDEAHSMGNAIAIKGKRGIRKPSQQAIAGINLQRELPNARVVYVSATGATEVSNLSYADRLGLWGEGTPFADANAFINGVSAGGIASMELISRDMKAMGMYLARSLSYDGVSYERMEHKLSELQEDIYNELAGAWQIVLNNVEKALEITQAEKSGQGKSAAMAQFWGAHQRFFNQIITAMQTPAVIDHIQQQLEAGHAAVIQIVNTNEASQERIIADAMAKDTDLEDLDFTPRQMLMDYVRNGFPVAAYEETKDDNGNTIYVPVKDAEGNQVFDREAIALRDALLESLAHIRVPENPLDSIINAFGSDTVAEITGRGRRFVQVRDNEGNLKIVEEKRGKNSSHVDAELFQADKKKILVFSGAGGTGYSFHADNSAVNTRKRIHYILQPGWRADAAVQGFGRTHRTNQATEPHYVLPTTNLKAQKRFVSSIARRLDQLGALTRGQRQASSQGMFTAADNLESEYAKAALYTFFVDLYQDRTGLNFQTVTRQMGLNLLDREGGFDQSKIPDIPQFLNRLLSLKTDQQNVVFDEFESRLVEAVEYAKQHGLYDEGLQTLRALSIKKSRDEVAYVDPKTGAQTRFVELDVTNELHYVEWDEIAAKVKKQQENKGTLSGWFVSEYGRNKGSVFFLDDRGLRISSDGEEIRRGVIYGIKKNGHRYIDNADVVHRGWEFRKVDGSTTKVTTTRRIDETEAERLWKAQIEEAPKTETVKTCVLVGVILPIWDRVEGSETIYRLQTDDGEQLLGRLLDQKAAKKTLKNLGLDSATANLSIAELFAAIQAGQRAVLSNGWEITLAKVNREDRIEIKGRLSDAERRVLTQQGAFVERINWQERVFIPTGDGGLSVFERITASKPVVDLFQKTRGNDMQEARLFRPSEPAAATYTIHKDGPISQIANEDAGAIQPREREQSISPKENKPMADKSEKKSFAQVVADKLITQLEQGAAPWQIPWNSAMPGSTFPMNPTTGKRYRGINAIHLMSQGYSDHRWMTYKQAAGVGAQVRKGEKGTPIQYWKYTEEQNKLDEHGKPILNTIGEPVKVTVKLERPRAFYATVFNAEQIEGLAPLQKKEQTWSAIERAEHILAASGASIAHVPGDRAFYRPATDSIQLPARGQFPSADAYYATALHELGHWTGHPSRLDRDLAHPFGSEGYAKEELRAEIASMILGDELGIGHDPGQHTAYVGSWIKALKDDPMEIFRAASDAEKIHDYVLAFEQKQVIEQQQVPSNGVEIKVGDRVRFTAHDVGELLSVGVVSGLVVNADSTTAGNIRYRIRTDEPAHHGDGSIEKLVYSNGGRIELLQPHELTLTQFMEQARVKELTNHGRAWEVSHNESFFAFSDAVTAQEAIADVHRGAVNTALFFNTTDAIASNMPQISFPPLAVLAEYPDLVKRFPEALGAPVLGQKPSGEVKSVIDRTSSQYEAIKAADEAFQRELVRAYGEDNAGDARYKLRHDDDAVQKAGEAFMAASAVWRDAVREARLAVESEEATMATMQTPAAQTKGVIKALEAAGWTRSEGAAIASKSFETVNGRNEALAFITNGDGINRTLQFQYTSEGRNATEADGALIPVGATAAQASEIAAAAAATAEKSIKASYGVRIVAMQQIDKQQQEAEAWALKHVEDGSISRQLESASLKQIDLALDVLESMQPMNTQNEFWMRHELPFDPEPLQDKINAVLDYLIDQRRPDAVVAAAFLDLKNGNNNPRVRERAFDAAAMQALGFTLPYDWTGEIRVMGVVERDGLLQAASAADIPEAYHLYARKGDTQPGEDAFAYLTTTYTLDEADTLADRLALIDANLQTDEYEKAARVARVQEDRVRRDPNSTDEDILAAKEARKALEAKAFVAAEEAKNQQEQRTEAVSGQQPAQAAERQYISVPFKEKEEAKQLGARWDRQQQSWYVPAGVDAAPFAKWAQGASTAAEEARPTPHAREGDGNSQQARQYLAVPYEQRREAKAAGALWDKAAKSWYAGPGANMTKLEKWLPENVQVQQVPAMTPREEFAEAMRSAGLVTQGEHPIMDGKRHRVPVDGGKKGAVDGFYVGHLDGHPAGRIINNKTGADITWKSKGYALSDQEKAKLQAEAAEKLALRAAEQDKLQEATAQRVGRQMADLVPVEQPTPYLQAKGIEAHAGVFTDREGQKTYIPAFDADGTQWTMQYIQEDGTKRFAKDSKKEGCFHPVGGMDALAAAPALVISEGYATAAQVAEAVGHATVAAFDSGNLEAVAKALHAKFPEKPIIIAGDDDRHLVMTHGNNPGREKAEAAARAVGGQAIFPIFAPTENSYPREVAAITPESYKTHLRAEQCLADAIAGKVELAQGEADKLKASMLSDAQVAALLKMKQHTDYNDLAQKSELGIEGVRRQIGAATSQARRDAQRPREQEHVVQPHQQEQRPQRAARIS